VIALNAAIYNQGTKKDEEPEKPEIKIILPRLFFNRLKHSEKDF